MNTPRLPIALLIAFSLAAGCSRDEPASGGAGHAAEGVVPGSYEDWCAEHEVPETQCTRCDTSLVSAFKPTNDWCAEHGLPESQCRQCNPGLVIARPPKPEGR
jgi:hypothetical protein